MLCELLLRGPQTPGELRTRASRMAPIREVGEVEAALERLAAREDGPFVVRLAREPGRRDSRYAHLFSGAPEGLPDASAGTESVHAPLHASPERAHDGPREGPHDRSGALLQDRVAVLERLVEELREEIEALKRP